MHGTTERGAATAVDTLKIGTFMEITNRPMLTLWMNPGSYVILPVLLFFLLCYSTATTSSSFQLPLMEGCCEYQHSPDELLTCAQGVSEILLKRIEGMRKLNHRHLTLGLYYFYRQFIRIDIDTLHNSSTLISCVSN